MSFVDSNVSLTYLYALYKGYELGRHLTQRLPQIPQTIVFPSDLMLQRWTEMGVRQDVRVIMANNIPMIGTLGSHLSPASVVAIYLNSTIATTQPNTREFNILTGAALLKSQYELKRHLVELITAIGCEFLLKNKLGLWKRFLVNFTLSKLAGCLLQRSEIWRAENSAMNHIITPGGHGLTPIVTYYQTTQETNRFMREHFHITLSAGRYAIAIPPCFLNRIIWSEAGEDRRRLLFEPRISDRLQRLQNHIHPELGQPNEHAHIPL